MSEKFHVESPHSPDDKLIVLVGETLYGPSFRQQLATLLVVRLDTVRHWCNGREAVPEGVWVQLDQILSHRQDELEAAIRAVADRVMIAETHRRRWAR